MWTHENRPKYNRDHLRYPSDLTDDEWADVEPLIPPAKPGGGRHRTDMRAVMNDVYAEHRLPCATFEGFSASQHVHNYFVWWQCDRVLDRIHHALYVECREKVERNPPLASSVVTCRGRMAFPPKWTTTATAPDSYSSD
jgi:transposase